MTLSVPQQAGAVTTSGPPRGPTRPPGGRSLQSEERLLQEMLGHNHTKRVWNIPRSNVNCRPLILRFFSGFSQLYQKVQALYLKIGHSQVSPTFRLIYHIR
jgi:hypothetical protein